MGQQRKKYTPEYRPEALSLVIESQHPIAHVTQRDWRRTRLFRPVCKNEREHRGSSDGLSEADIRAENARLRRELAEVKMDDEFYQSDNLLRFEATRTEKFELMQSAQGKFQYQTHGALVEGISVWILQMGSYAGLAECYRISLNRKTVA